MIDPSIRSAEVVGSRLIATTWGGEATIVCPALDGWGGVDLDADWAGIVVMGSAASVCDPSEWRDRIAARIARALTGPDATPILGICYGHQLVAKVAGARVGPMTSDRVKETGIRTIAITGACPLFDANRASYRIAVSHYDEAKSVPTGFRTVAAGTICAIHAIAHESRPVFGIQGHPEFSDAALEVRGHDGPSDPARIRDGRDILARFAHVVRSTRGY